MNDNTGSQSIGCEVASCAYHGGSACELNRITVRPCTNCGSGNAEDETLCGSYRAK